MTKSLQRTRRFPCSPHGKNFAREAITAWFHFQTACGFASTVLSNIQIWRGGSQRNFKRKISFVLKICKKSSHRNEIISRRDKVSAVAERWIRGCQSDFLQMEKETIRKSGNCVCNHVTCLHFLSLSLPFQAGGGVRSGGASANVQERCRA